MNYEEVKDKLPEGFSKQLFEKFISLVKRKGINDISIRDEVFVLQRGPYRKTTFGMSYILSEAEYILSL